MYECINCGHVQMTNGACYTCHGAMIPALDQAAAKEQYIIKLQHRGIELSDKQLEQIANR